MTLPIRMSSRCGSHRSQQAQVLGASWRRRVAARLVLLFVAVRCLDELLRYEWQDAPIEFRAARLKAKVARDRAWPLLNDVDGRAWE
jgi:uncharacterized protein (DUF952 family)